MPFALDEIRKLGKMGLTVFATDTFASAPGSHSRYVEESLVTPRPRQEPLLFLHALREIVESRRIELLLPAFEEVFYIARHRDWFKDVEIFAPSFETLATLHDKVRFMELARGVGLKVARTIVVTSRDDLAAAAREIGEFLARPAYSRGGLDLYTNTGPLAGALSLEDCDPSPASPWLVQEFLHGVDCCSFSVVHHGRVAAHSTYVHPKSIDHAGGIVFESIESPETLAAASRIAEATGYHGQISFDFMTTDRGVYAIECNPRPTAGVIVMPTRMFVDALLNAPRAAPAIAPRGRRRKISVALIRDMVLNWKEIPSDMAELFSSAKDVYAEPGDLLPALYQLLSYAHVSAYRKHLGTGSHKRSDLMAAYFFDTCWDGEPIP
jgi:predicted ATP-grasp superfamily ATP-dependent carboligase